MARRPRLSLLLPLLGLFCLLLSACASTNPPNSADAKNERLAAGYNVQLGMGYLQQGNVQRAKVKLLQALKQAPDWPPALDAMGYFLEKTGEAKQAYSYYARSLDLAPQDGSVLNNYGTYLCRQKKYKQAEAYFMAAIKDPNYITTAEAYENAGLCALEMPNESKAAYYFKKALLQDPQRLSVVGELAKLCFKQQQYLPTIQYVDTYLALSKGNPNIIFLGYQAALNINDPVAASRYASLLKNNYPGTSEAQQVQ